MDIIPLVPKFLPNFTQPCILLNWILWIKNYILKEIKSQHLKTKLFTPSKYPIFFDHFQLQKVNNSEITFFETLLPKVQIHPTALGVIFRFLIIFILVFVLCIICYCCNDMCKTYIKINLCCNKKKIKNKEEKMQDKKASTPPNSIGSIDELKNMDSFLQNTP